jgi:hypothetical protein
MSEAALTRRRDGLGGESVGEAVHRLCVWAVTRQGLDAPVPLLHPLASGDQLAVIGRELLDWVEATSSTDALAAWRIELDRVRRAV